ncbi:hypothetical protein TNCV_1708061 [Trichonephila clavipes]|nr:hypothetical protein TNCV_1708061 [Trichonephila clavipes]
MQIFFKLVVALELLNGLDSDENDGEISVSLHASELTDEGKWAENEVNTNEIIVKDVPGSLAVGSEDSFQPEPPRSSSILTTNDRKKAKRHQSFWIGKLLYATIAKMVCECQLSGTFQLFDGLKEGKVPLRIVTKDDCKEAHLWFNDYVNKQNCRIWSEANQQVYVETPLHPEKLTVSCALWAGGILLQKR